ncbi:hypothetical protein SPRG_08977 [Saprolegnia parasitica CBS 223.65]|uniref:Uncharacterized protein n=1 Tax=Saprolegnia parasitica (strain CBS 223.65) TaxID=695850 RepID=A0A067C5B7_SAPPC|nr:hypothetical protein SPRG_08977 [Saprolegnia parasitica CBS 223.65]KDO25678.1 hypothetical protein SPRG_08977 [Saprolegnia parasitica CBS 223.65]|eukprot:XP_012203708.1 hypothetical protein SPRG_08977 [Saprolegnia parasitica CBS 223.65]
MQGDIASRRQKTQKTLVEKQAQAAAVATEALPPPPSLAKGTKRILKQNGWDAMSPRACVNRLLADHALHRREHDQERTRRETIDSETGQAFFRPKINKSNLQRHGDICVELYDQAKATDEKRAALQSQLQHKAQQLATPRMNPTSLKVYKKRLLREVDVLLSLVPGERSDDGTLSSDHLLHVFGYFGVLPPTVATPENTLWQHLQATVTTVRVLKEWLFRIVLAPAELRGAQKQLRQHYLSRDRHAKRTSDDDAAPKHGPSAAGTYSMHGHLVSASKPDPTIARQRELDAKLQWLRDEKRAREQAECTFAPDLPIEVRPPDVVAQRLYEQGLEQRRERDERVHAARLAKQAQVDRECTRPESPSAADRLQAFLALPPPKPVDGFEKAVQSLRRGHAERAWRKARGDSPIALHLDVTKFRSEDGRTTVPQPFHLTSTTPKEVPSATIRRRRHSQWQREAAAAVEDDDDDHVRVQVHISPTLVHTLDVYADSDVPTLVSQVVTDTRV